MSKRRKRIRIAQYIFVGIVTLMFSCYFALQLPAVQTWLAHRLSDYLSSEWNTRVSVGRVKIDLWAKLSATDLYIEDQRGDSLLYVAEVKADNYSFDDKSGKLVINSLHLDRPYFNLMRHRGDSLLNYSFLVDYFDSPDTTKSQNFIVLNHAHLQGGRFNYIDENRDADTTFGIDWHRLQLSNIELEANEFRMENDSIHSFITHLELSESSGFELREFSQELTLVGGDVRMKDTRLVSGESTIEGDLGFSFQSIEDFENFETNVPMQHTFRNARLNLNDLAYFSPELKGFDIPISIDGTIRGTVANLQGRNLDLQFKNNSRFRGKVDMEGLPDIDMTYISMDIDELTTTKEELEQIPLSPFDGKTFLKVPDNIAYLGKITYRGDFTGFISDFVTYGTVSTAIGDMKTDISIKEEPLLNDYAYSGAIHMQQFQLGTFYNSDLLGAISCDIEIEGSGLELEKVNATFNGQIQSLEMNGYAYHNISASGNFRHHAFSGNIDIDDPNLAMTFDGAIDFAEREPLLDFEARIQHSSPEELHILTDYQFSSLIGDIQIRSEGFEFEKFSGDILIKDLAYCAKDDDYSLNRLHIQSTRVGTPRITLDSDLANAELSGDFNISQITPALAEIASTIFPSFQPPIRQHKTQNFKFNAQIFNAAPITEVFLPALSITPGARINLEVNEPASYFQTTITSPSLTYNGTQIDALTIDIHHPDESFYITASCDLLDASNVLFRDIALDGRTLNDTLYTALSWNNGNRQFEGDINGKFAIRDFHSFDFVFDKSSFVLEKEQWFFEPGAKIEIDSTTVNLQQINLRNQDQHIHLGGSLHSDKNSEIDLEIAAFDLQNLHVFLGDAFVFEGVLDAKASIRDPYNDPIFNSNLSVQDLIINKHAIGDLSALTAWNPKANELRIDGNLEKEVPTNTGLIRKTPLTFSGYYRPNDTKSPLDLTATIRDLDLDFINAFLEPEILDIKGYASATMAITGTPDAPQMRADAYLREASVFVYYLNTTYYLKNRIGVYPDMFTFDHIPIQDELGKNGVLTGQMLHENFSQWNFDLLIEMNEPMLAMNTGEAQNSMYFGQAYTTGAVNISGYDSNLAFDISLRSEKGTNIALPMGTGSEQEFENFIRFRAPGDTQKKEEPLNLSGVTLNLQLEITPEADFRIIFDESIGDVIYGSGQGNLQMVINNLATFSMYGDIELTGGKYDFNLKNLINKSFTLQPGGTISWFGDPFGGEMNLKAIYPIQASLYDLIPDPTYQSGQRVDVELGMNMTGKIFSPGIDFSINLPSVDQMTKSRVNAVISTDQERNRQAFALLAMKRFISPPNVTSDHSSTSAIAANGTEFLSSQISSWLSQISDDFNLGFNYNPGDDISSEQVALALGTQLFNERLSLSSNFGVARNNNTAAANQNATNIIGDIRIEYKITPEGKVRLVMYNESNDFRATTVQQSPYTQGVGVIYREDFDTFDDLIEGFKKMLKGDDKPSSSTQ